jgi:hypothetical protein
MSCKAFPVFIFLASMTQLGLGASPSEPQGADALFANPPARFRILKMIHRFPETPEGQDKLLASLNAQKFGGMVTNVPFKDYLQSEPQWQQFVRVVHEAKKAGMALWLYDEHGYPSGTAGGLTLRDHPEWEARGLLIADRVIRRGAAAIDVPPGQLKRAAAFPVAGGRIDLDRAVELSDRVRDGKLTWDAPEGEWHVMVFTEDRLYEGTHAAVSLAGKLPYINLLQPEPTAKFLELTHDAYARHLGNDLGQWFIATFTDEPSLMSVFLRSQPYRVLPWSPNLAEQFQKRRGYAIEPLLPALVGNAGSRGLRARYDFRLTVGELVAENFFGQIRDWCRQHHVPSGGHLLAEESLLAHAGFYGDFFRCARCLDAPSIDCLTSIPHEVPWFIARLISSIGELEGRPDTMCETSDHSQQYRRPDDTRPVRVVTEDEIRGTCNRLIVNGITTITSYYRFKSLTDNQLRRLNLWIGRASAMLYGGHQVTDVAVLYPIESLWPKFVPSRHGASDVPPEGQQVASLYSQASKELFTHGRDFTYIDSRALAEAQADGGVLRLRDLRWRVVVLPAVDTLPAAAWENLAKFWRTGGVVVAIGARPTNSAAEFPSPAAEQLAREMFGEGDEVNIKVNAAGGVAVYLPARTAGQLATVLDRIVDPEVRLSAANTSVRSTHRSINGQEVFFLINDQAEAWEGDVNLAADGPGRRYDLGSGAISPASTSQGIHVKLGPYGGTLFRFDKSRIPHRRAVTAGDLSAAIQATAAGKK